MCEHLYKCACCVYAYVCVIVCIGMCVRVCAHARSCVGVFCVCVHVFECFVCVCV